MLSNKVLEWINNTGFPLEMEAAAAFRSAGFEVRQSFSYPDPQESKGREIDVLAQDPDPYLLGVIDVSFVLECKSSSKPWVVLTSDDALANYNRIFALAITSRAAKDVLWQKIRSNESIKRILQRSKRGGYGFRQALGSKDDKGYSAAISAVKACKGITIDRENSTIPKLAFAFPVIVVDSPLFECSLTEDGKLDLVEVQESEFLFSAYLPEDTGCCVKVIKKERLLGFAIEAKKLAEEIRGSLKDDEEEAFSSNKGDLK